MNDDITKMSDEELMKIAGVQSEAPSSPEIAKASDAELAAAAGVNIEENKGLDTMAKKILPTWATGAKPLPGERTLLGNIFERPGAALRSGIQSAAKGKGFIPGYVKGSMEPEKVPTFQELSIEKFQPKTTSVLANFAGGLVPSVAGLAADVITSPADALLMFLGKAPTPKPNIVNTANKVDDAVRAATPKITKIPTRGINNSKQLEQSRKNLTLAVDTIVDNKKNLFFADESVGQAVNKLPDNLEEAGQAVTQTKKAVWDVVEKASASATNKGLKIKVGERVAPVLDEVINDQVMQVNNPDIVQSAMKMRQRLFDVVQEATDPAVSKKVYYHGTNKPEAIKKTGFKAGRGVERNSSFVGDNIFEGVHLSTSKKPYKPGGQLEDVREVLKTNIDAKKILKTDFKSIPKLYQKYGINEMSRGASKKLTNALAKDGYEAVQYSDEIVVFDPAKVRLLGRPKQGPIVKSKEFTPQEVEDWITKLNAETNAYYANPNPNEASMQPIKAAIANRLRDALNQTISESTGIQYQEFKHRYGALLTFEKAINKKIFSEAKKVYPQLIDYTDIMNVGQIGKGFIMQDAGSVLQGAGGLATKQILKLMKDPNIAVRQMFQRVDALKNPSPLSGAVSKGINRVLTKSAPAQKLLPGSTRVLTRQKKEEN